MPNPTSDELTDGQRARLAAGLGALAGATLQKLWLSSAQVCVLQLRVPGQNLLAVVDARLALAAIAAERPTAADSAPRSQATLRRALTGARFDGAEIVRIEGGPLAVRLRFSAEAGARTLVAEQDSALLLLDEGRRIVWASSGAGTNRRPGSIHPEARVLAVAEEALADPIATVQRAVAQEERAGFEARQREVLARLRARVQKLRRTLAAVEDDAARATKAASERARAELLLPHQGRIPRGAREARVPDWTDVDGEGRPAYVVLALDASLSAAENATRWLKRAKRYGAATGRIAARRAEVAASLAGAEATMARAAAARDGDALALVEGETAPLHEQRRSAPAAKTRLPYRTFRSSSGAPILVGRSARDNDALTLRVVRGNDVWMHARGVQGAHVVLPGAGEAPDSRALSDAALLAVHFSSARGEDAAEVAWTRKKHVRKVKGAPPGAVLISQEKTLLVRADSARLAALLATEVV